MNNLVLLVFVGFAAFFVIRMFWVARPGITPAEANSAVQAGKAVLIDVREPAEWSSGVAKPASLLSYSDLRSARGKWDAFLNKHRGQRLIVYCASGARSGSAARMLRKEGHDAVNLGGFSRWVGAGLPVRRPH